jgi:hypothetical protein
MSQDRKKYLADYYQKHKEVMDKRTKRFFKNNIEKKQEYNLTHRKKQRLKNNI